MEYAWVWGENMDLPQRKKNRLSGFDYSSTGAYFVTICTYHHVYLLCDDDTIVGDGSPVPNGSLCKSMQNCLFPVPNHWGRIAEKYINEIPMKYPGTRISNYVVMPNHIHILLEITKDESLVCSPTLGTIIGWYKYNTTKAIRAEFDVPDGRVFQRSYHDHIVRGEKDYKAIWEYIEHNPAQWDKDCFYKK